MIRRYTFNSGGESYAWNRDIFSHFSRSGSNKGLGDFIVMVNQEQYTSGATKPAGMLDI